MSEVAGPREPLERLAEEFVRRYRGGERPSPEEYARAHPEHAEEIRELFPALVLMEELAPGESSAGGAAAAGPPAARPGRPERVGDYHLLREIGRGGMGVVYEAEQLSLGRRVALKLLYLPAGPGGGLLERFRREARAAAQLHHTNIVPVFEVGQDGDTCYYAMQLIHGQGLDEVVKELRGVRGITGPGGDGRPTVSAAGPVAQSLQRGRFEAPDLAAASAPPGREAGSTVTLAAETDLAAPDTGGRRYFQSVARLGVQVAEALAYAHQRGILHRDVKPSNLLLDTAGVVWVTDFGLAKYTPLAAPAAEAKAEADLTHTGDIVGTVRYMAPERFHGRCDARADVYGLGLTLYELLTLRPAFDGTDRLRLVGQIGRQEPPRPRALDRRIPPDLETVVLRAIDKEPGRRYATAADLAADLRRFLADEPVHARRPSALYRLRKFAHRNQALVTSAAAVALTLLVAVAAVSWKWWQAEEARRREEAAKGQAEGDRDRALRAERQARLRQAEALVGQAHANRLSRQLGRRLRSLELLAEATGLARELGLADHDSLELRNETVACLALVDLRAARTWEGVPAGTLFLDFDANLERYVRVNQKGMVSVRRVADDSEVSRVPPLGRPREAVPVLSPDGRFLGLHDGPVAKVWKVTGPKAELLLQGPGHNLRFSPDSRRAATAGADGRIVVYELPSGKPLKQWQAGPSPGFLAFHPSGRQLAVRHPGRIAVFDLDSGKKRADFAQQGSPWDALTWYPDGKRLAAVGAGRCIDVVEAATGKRLHRLAGHNGDGIFVAVNPAGDLLTSWSWDEMLRLWDARSGRELFKTRWWQASTYPRFSHDGRLLAAEVTAHQVRFWEVLPASGYRSLEPPPLAKKEYLGLAASRKQPLLAVGMEDGVGLWKLPGGRPLGFLSIGPHLRVAFDPSGALLTNMSGRQMRIPIEAAGPGAALRIGPPQPLPFPPSPHHVATSRDGRVLASAQGWGALVHHADLGGRLVRLEPQYDTRFVAVSPDGRWVATGSHSTTDVYVKVWDARSGRHAADLPVDGSSAVAFSPDGRWLATTGGGCRLWAVGTWREGPKVGGTSTFAFSPNGKVLAVETGTGAIRLVDPHTGREYVCLEDPNQDRAGSLTFSADGSQLFSSVVDNTAVHVWDLSVLRAGLVQRGLRWNLPD